VLRNWDVELLRAIVAGEARAFGRAPAVVPVVPAAVDGKRG
jgi:hypothetical protein